MRPITKISCSKLNYPLVDCQPKRRRSSARKGYGVKPRHAKLFDALESAGWKRYYGLFVPKHKRKDKAPLPPENVAAIQLLDSWLNENAQEQGETWKRLKRALEENRISNRNLFS